MPTIEHRTAGEFRLMIRMRMNINRVKPLLALKESLPYGRQRQRTRREKHECNLLFYLKRLLRPTRNHGRSPQKLLVLHPMLHGKHGVENNGCTRSVATEVGRHVSPEREQGGAYQADEHARAQEDEEEEDIAQLGRPFSLLHELLLRLPGRFPLLDVAAQQPLALPLHPPDANEARPVISTLLFASLKEQILRLQLLSSSSHPVIAFAGSGCPIPFFRSQMKQHSTNATHRGSGNEIPNDLKIEEVCGRKKLSVRVVAKSEISDQAKFYQCNAYRILK